MLNLRWSKDDSYLNLKQSVPPSVGRNSVDELATVPSFLHNNRNLGSSSNVDLDFDTSDNLNSAKGTAMHHYDTKAKRKATALVRSVAAEMIITCL